MSTESPAVRASLDDGKNISREPESDDIGRYDCRQVYQNMELEADDGETAHYRCGSWACYCCGHRMRMNLVEELDRLVEERPQLRRLLTITVDPATAPEGTDAQHRYLTERWNALRTEINDRYPSLSYVWIREEGESGNPHLHLLVDRYLPQSMLSRTAQRVGLGEVVDIRRVNARNAARYVTKYLTKGALADLPTGANRYGCSSDITLDVRGGGGDSRDWRLMMDDYEILARGSERAPLRREATSADLWLQKRHGGPLGLPPPSESD